MTHDQNKTTLVIKNCLGEWIRLEGKEWVKSSDRYHFTADVSVKNNHYPFGIHILEPGIYSLDRVRFITKDADLSFDDLGPKKRVTFIANPGEMVYIGDLTFNVNRTKESWRHSNLDINVQDHFEAAKAYLSKEWPNLDCKQLKKQLVKVD